MTVPPRLAASPLQARAGPLPVLVTVPPVRCSTDLAAHWMVPAAAPEVISPLPLMDSVPLLTAPRAGTIRPASPYHY